MLGVIGGTGTAACAASIKKDPKTSFRVGFFVVESMVSLVALGWTVLYAQGHLPSPRAWTPLVSAYSLIGMGLLCYAAGNIVCQGTSWKQVAINVMLCVGSLVLLGASAMTCMGKIPGIRPMTAMYGAALGTAMTCITCAACTSSKSPWIALAVMMIAGAGFAGIGALSYYRCALPAALAERIFIVGMAVSTLAAAALVGQPAILKIV